jgi:hypothetical protein
MVKLNLQVRQSKRLTITTNKMELLQQFSEINSSECGLPPLVKIHDMLMFLEYS